MLCISPEVPMPSLFFSHLIQCMHYSLSLALPVGPSSSSSPSTTSSPAICANSAFCNVLLNSVFLGSTSSKAFSLALLRILHSPHQLHTPSPPRPHPISGRYLTRASTNLGSAPASNNNSTKLPPTSHSSFANPLTNRTALCNGVSRSILSSGSTSSPS